MPRKVDLDDRMRKIAEATLRVAERGGVSAITIRSVAAEVGGSSAIVTNYVATRADLLLNAILHVQQKWDHEMDDATHGLEGTDLLRALVLWSVTTEPEDRVVRRIWVELMAMPDSHPATQSLVDIALRHRDLIRQALATIVAARLDGGASSAGVPKVDLDGEADMLYLMIRGFYLLSVENPDAWPEERISGIMNHTLDLLG